jgi:tRNA threonylcarbamoyladenosine biosynthesis protein TsaE
MSAHVLHLNLTDTPATEALGTGLGLTVPAAGGILYLRGQLGAGKTTCARSLLRQLGVAGTIRSPTYTLVDSYATATLVCVHVDLYRVQSALEVDELGLRDLTVAGHLLLIEWPERGEGAVPPADLDVWLQYWDESRTAILSACSTDGRGWLSRLERNASIASYVSNLA